MAIVKNLIIISMRGGLVSAAVNVVQFFEAHGRGFVCAQRTCTAPLTSPPRIAVIINNYNNNNVFIITMINLDRTARNFIDDVTRQLDRMNTYTRIKLMTPFTLNDDIIAQKTLFVHANKLRGIPRLGGRRLGGRVAGQRVDAVALGHIVNARLRLRHRVELLRGRRHQVHGAVAL